MWEFRLLRSPPLLLLLPQLSLGIAASRSQAETMNLGGGSGAPFSPSAEGRRPQCLQLSTVPGADPQRSNELLLLAAETAGEGPERRALPGDRAKEEPQPAPQHHVLYFPGDVQVTWGLPGHLFLPRVHMRMPPFPPRISARFLACPEHTHTCAHGVALPLLHEIQNRPCHTPDPVLLEPQREGVLGGLRPRKSQLFSLGFDGLEFETEGMRHIMYIYIR